VSETNKQLYRQLIQEAFDRGDLATVDRIVSPDLEEHEKPPAGIPANREGLKTLITSLRAAFPDLKSTIEDITADGDKVWARLTVQGTNKGSFMGAPPTSKKVNFEVMDVVRISDGKIVEHWGVTDNLGFMQQLGIVQVPWEVTAGRR
jgi:steroid delta-isomerase-like uncharacterized protein